MNFQALLYSIAVSLTLVMGIMLVYGIADTNSPSLNLAFGFALVICGPVIGAYFQANSRSDKK